jgi:membrane fusion protein (multidrug efflux system)
MRKVFQGRGGAWCALVLTGLASVMSGCGGGGTSSASAATQQGGRGPRGDQPPPAVELAAAELGTVARTVTVAGLSEPIRSVGVNAQLSGALLAVNVEEGDVVREGQVLARLDSRELQAQVASAKANLEVARNTLTRSETLRESQVITAAEFERDRAAHAAASATLEQLETRLGYATVRAPISGVITQKRLEAGDIVAPQTRLFTIADMSTMVVRTQVSELDVLGIRVGQDVNVVLDALPERVLDGRVRRIFPSADTLTRLVPVEVALVGEGARIARPGFLGRVTFTVDSRQNVVLVPQGAIRGGEGDQSVFLVRDGKAVRRPVETGMTSQGRVEIVSGLEPGEMVIVLAHSDLREGTTVRISNQAPRIGDSANGDASPAGNGGRP